MSRRILRTVENLDGCGTLCKDDEEIAEATFHLHVQRWFIVDEPLMGGYDVSQPDVITGVLELPPDVQDVSAGETLTLQLPDGRHWNIAPSDEHSSPGRLPVTGSGRILRSRAP